MCKKRDLDLSQPQHYHERFRKSDLKRKQIYIKEPNGLKEKEKKKLSKWSQEVEV